MVFSCNIFKNNTRQKHLFVLLLVHEVFIIIAMKYEKIFVIN